MVATLGIIQIQKAPLDVYPEFAPPQVQIQTEALGLSAAEVEQLITVPMEQDLLNGIAWLQQIRSESSPGLSSIELIFEPGTDILKARQLVQERMVQAHALPNVGSSPFMVQPVSSDSRVMMIGLGSKDLSAIDLSVLARWKIKPRLQGIPGVANVAIWGQRDRQLQVQVNPDKLRQYGVSVTQVLKTTGNALWVSPLTFVQASTPGTGGFIDTNSQRLAIQHILPITTPQSLASVSVEDTGDKRLHLGDVATVVEDHQPLIGDAVLNDGPGLMLVIEKFPESNTREVTAAVEDAMNALKPGLAGITVDTNVYRPASYIEDALGHLGLWAIVGLVILFVLFAAAFFSLRMALISFVSLALSVITALWVLHLRGATLNVMVLVGLTIALGAIVDDAVTDAENIRRRLREHRASGGDAPLLGVVVDASHAVRRPLLYTTLILLLATLPLFFLGGVPGAFSGPLAMSYGLAIVASAVVALTVTPALAVVLLSRGRLDRRPSPAVRLVHWGFDRTMPAFLGRRWPVYLAIVLLIAAGFALLPQLGTGNGSLLPPRLDRNLLVRWQTAAGTSLAEMDRVTSAAAGEVRAISGVRAVGAHVGRAIASDQTVNVNAGELWIGLTDTADYDATAAEVRRVVRGYPGMQVDLASYAEQRVDTARAAAGGDLVVRVYGYDLDILRSKADEVKQLLTTVDGVTDPKVAPQPPDEPTLEVKVDLQAAQRFGIKPGDVRRAAGTFFSGLPVGNLYEDQKVFDVVVLGTPTTRFSPSNVGDLLIDLPAGGQVRLGDVATVRTTSYPTTVRHTGTSRSIDVIANVRGRSAGSVAADVKGRLPNVSMPLEYHAEVLDEVSGQRDQALLTAGLALIALIGIFLLLQAAFRSWRTALLVLLTLPLAAVGGVLAAGFSGGVLTLGALAGLAAVLGLALRNVMVLVHGYQEAGAVGADEILRVTRDRAGPVVLTAVATAAVVVPVLVLGRVSGLEVLFPLAAVLLGGLVTSTLLTLVITPALYLQHAPARN
ncbi:efflux RND transporter permease subunit [Lentzea nigeriaca]